MFRVDGIVLREIRLPLKEPFRISSGVVTQRRICLVELTSDDGVTGWSECVAGEQPNYSAETIDTAWHAMREWLAPRLLRSPVGWAADGFPLFGRNVCGRKMAKTALQLGSWGGEC